MTDHANIANLHTGSPGVRIAADYDEYAGRAWSGQMRTEREHAYGAGARVRRGNLHAAREPV